MASEFDEGRVTPVDDTVGTPTEGRTAPTSISRQGHRAADGEPSVAT